MQKNPELLNSFIENSENTKYNFLLTAISYEERGFTSVKKIIENFSFTSVYLFSFGTRYLDEYLIKKWEKQKKDLANFFKEKKIPYQIIECNPILFKTTFEQIKDLSPPLIINITTFPKNYILKLAKEFDNPINIFIYSKSDYREPSIDELNSCVENILPIEGFEGTREISNEDMLVLILGYEGHRALSFLSKFSPHKILPLIGIPRLGNIDEDEFYYKNVLRCNWNLLRKQSVIKNEWNYFFLISSLSHIDCYNEMSSIITEKIKEDHDLCISPLGTKPQTLGLYLFWRDHPETQIIYSIPVTRFDITQLKTTQISDVSKKEKNALSNEIWVYSLPEKISTNKIKN